MASVFSASGRRIATPPATDEFGQTSQVSVVTAEASDAARLAGKWDRSRVRRDRFLDARTRTIGIDVDALDAQVAEKAARKAAEKEEEMAYAAEQARIARAIASFERDIAADKARQQAAVNHSVATQLNSRVLSDSYALNDKTAIKREKPARVGDDDPRCGPASLQKFDGEDRLAGERMAMQAAQMAEWCKTQSAMRAAKLEAERDEELAYAEYLESIGKMRDEVEAAHARAAKEEALKIKAANDRMARERREAAEREKARADRINHQELEATVRGGILTEDLNDAVSALGPHRTRPDHYRGMTPEQRAAWAAEVEAQRKAHAAAKAAAKAEDEAYAAEQAKHVRDARRFEAELARRRREEQAQYLAALETQKREQAERLEAEKKAEKALYIGKGFYDGFGQSDR